MARIQQRRCCETSGVQAAAAPEAVPKALAVLGFLAGLPPSGLNSEPGKVQPSEE